MADAQLTVSLDPASVKAIADAVSGALEKGFKDATASIADEIKKLTDKISESMSKGFGKAGTDSGEKFAKAWKKKFEESLPAIEKELARSMKAVAKVFNQDVADMAAGAQAAMKSVIGAGDRMMSPKMMKNANNMSRNQMRLLMEGNRTQRSGAWGAIEQSNVAMSAFGKMEAARIKAEAAATNAARRAADKTAYAQLQASLRQQATAQRDAGRLRQTQAAAAGRLQVAQEKNAGKQMAIAQRAAADQATNAARVAGEQRVAITKAVLKSIIMLERGIGRAIEGTAKTITSGLGRAASSIGGLFRRSDSQMNSGLGGALNSRERMMRSSFMQQETIVRRSVLRQQEQINKLQAQSSKGVVGAITGRGIGGGLAALGGGLAIGSWLKGGYQEAVNLNEQLNKTNIVFGESAASVVDFASNAVNAFGATKAEALTAAGTFGNLFRSVKLGEKQSAEMSTTLVQLAGDLSSFNNVSIDEAFDALRSGLVGETEPLKRFGVNLNDATLKAKALEMGLYSGKGVLDANTKAQAAYALILEQTTLAQGDFARTSDEGANAQRRAGKAMKELAASIMASLIPIMTKAFNLMTAGFTAVSDIINNKTNPALRLVKRALVGAAAGMAAVLAVKGVIEVFKLLGTVVKLALTPFGALLVIFGLLGAAISVMMDRSAALRKTMGILWDRIKSLGSTVTSTLNPALGSAGGILDDYVIPAIDTAAQWLADHLLPAFDAVARFVTRTVIPAFKAVVSFITGTVFPLIATVASTVANALGAAAGAVKRFWDAVSAPSIGETIGNILGKIKDALLPVGKAIAAFFMGLFTADKIKMYIKGILWFVEQVGFWVAKIVTHPNFIKAIGVIAAAAVVLGATLLKGVIRGIIDNLPGLINMIGDALEFAFELIIDNLGVVVMAAFAAWLFGAKLINMFKLAGETGGKSLGVAFGKGAIAATKAYFQGPSGFHAIAVKNAQMAARASVREFNKANNLLRMGGMAPISSQGAFVSDKNLMDAKNKVEELRAKLGDTAFAALEARNAFDSALRVLKGSAGVIRNVGQNFQFVTETGAKGFTRLRDVFKLTMSEIRQVAAKEGMTVGEAFKTMVAKAAAGAASALGGAMAGYAAGKSGVGGVGLGLTAAMAGVAATAATGNVAIGAATGAVTLIGAAFGASAKKAEEFKKKVNELTVSFKDDLNKALEDGRVRLSDIRAGLVDLGDLASTGTIADAFTKELGADGLAVLGDFKLTWDKTFKPIIKEGGSADQIKKKLTDAFADTVIASKDFRDRFGDDAEKVGELLRNEFDSGIVKMYDLQKASTRVSDDLGDLTSANRAYLESILYTAGDLKRATDLTSESIAGATDEVAFLANTVDGVAGKAWQEYYRSVSEAGKSTKEQIEDNKDLVERLGEAWQGAVDAITDYALLGSGSSFQQAVDNALMSVDGLGSRIAESLKSGATMAGQNPISASLRQDLDSLGADLTSVVQKGLAEGTIVTPADALRLTMGLREAALAGLDPGSEAYKLIEQQFNTALSALAPKIDQAAALSEAERFQQEVTTYWEAHPTMMRVEAEIAIKNKNLAFQGGTTGNRFGGTEIVTPTIKIASKVTPPAVAQTKADFIDTGKAANDGFAKGVRLYTWVVERAARSMATAAKNAAENQLDIRSPSKVFATIGEQVAAGLAAGINDSTEDAAGAARSIVDAAVQSAVTAAQSGTAAVTAATAQLFSAMTGADAPTGTGGKAMGLSQVIADITNATQGLNTTFASSAQSVWDATSKPVNERSAADKNLIGESASSLNPADVVGAANLAAVMQVLESIRQYGMTLLGSGGATNSVIAKVQAQINAFIKNATALGFKAPDLNRIIDEMGLSPADLAAFAAQASNLSMLPTTSPGSMPANVLPSTSAQALYNRQAGAAMAASQSNVEITNQIYLPTGDPQANALAVANRQASMLWS